MKTHHFTTDELVVILGLLQARLTMKDALPPFLKEVVASDKSAEKIDEVIEALIPKVRDLLADAGDPGRRVMSEVYEGKPLAELDDEDYQILENMDRYGGSFVKALAQLVRRADGVYLKGLVELFGHIFEDYTSGKIGPNTKNVTKGVRHGKTSRKSRKGQSKSNGRKVKKTITGVGIDVAKKGSDDKTVVTEIRDGKVERIVEVGNNSALIGKEGKGGEGGDGSRGGGRSGV